MTTVWPLPWGSAPSHGDNTERRGRCRSVRACVWLCACVHNRFGSADSVHVHLNCSTQRHHRKPQETEFDAISISMRKHKQDFLFFFFFFFFFKYSVSPMAHLPSIGSLQTELRGWGNCTQNRHNVKKKEKRLLKGFWSFLRPLSPQYVFQRASLTKTVTSALGRLWDSPQKMFRSSLSLSFWCLCYASSLLLSSSSSCAVFTVTHYWLQQPGHFFCK